MHHKIISTHHDFHRAVHAKLVWANIMREGTKEDRAMRHEIMREIEQNNLHNNNSY
jgi:hypothetical protein